MRPDKKISYPLGAGTLDQNCPDRAEAAIRVTTLRHFASFVRERGGDPATMFAAAGIPGEDVTKASTFVSFRSWARLLNMAAIRFECPELGLILAHRRSRAPILGPLEIVMYNSRTLGDALRFCEEHAHVYSPGARMDVERGERDATTVIHFENCLPHLPHHEQLVEHTVALAHFGIIELSDRDVQPEEIWFMHQPIAPRGLYHAHLGGKVRFGMPSNAIVIKPGDIDREVRSRNEHLYEMSVSYIDSHYPSEDRALVSKVRELIGKLLATGRCTHIDVAAAVGLHPRTLQRRLHDRGVTFDGLKDDVRRVLALRLLRDRSTPLSRVTTMLGYSEPSVLTRSCYRWFANSPRYVRMQLRGSVIDRAANQD